MKQASSAQVGLIVGNYNDRIQIISHEEGIVLKDIVSGRLSLPINADGSDMDSLVNGAILIKETDGNKYTIVATASMACLRGINLIDYKKIGSDILFIDAGHQKAAFLKFPYMRTTGWLDIASYEVINANLILLTDSKYRVKSFKPNSFEIGGCLSASDCALLRKKVMPV